MKVVLINGSPHKNGETAKSLEIVSKVLKNQGIEILWFQLGSQPVRGCIDCQKCEHTNRCTFVDDKCNELIEKILESDGVIIGSPVYFAGPNGALCALLDRAFYAASNYGYLFSNKLGAAVVSCWRAGGTASLDRLNKYFTFSEMPIISSNYWNMKYNTEDLYGNEILERLGEKMAEMLLRKERQD